MKTIGAAFRVIDESSGAADGAGVLRRRDRRPLRDFLGAHTPELSPRGRRPPRGGAPPPRARGDHVCDAYKALAEASLDTVRKNEEALRRLHAKRDGSGAKEGEVADSAKIAAQLLLDVDARRAELAGLGVEREERDSIGTLMREVAFPTRRRWRSERA